MNRKTLTLLPLVISISFAMDVYIASIPQMVTALNTNSTMVQWTLTIFMLSVGLGQLLFGPLSDKLGRRPIAIGSALLFCLGSIACVFATHIDQLILMRWIQACGACGTYVIAFAVVRDWFSAEDAAKHYSQLNGLNSVISVSAPIIGGYIAARTHHWQGSFIFLSFLALVIFVITLKYLPESRPHADRQQFQFKQTLQYYSSILKQIRFISYTLFAITAMTGLYFFCCLSPHILIEQYHLVPSTYGYFFGANAATVFLANFISPLVVKRLSLNKTIQLGTLIMLGGITAMAMASHIQPSSLSFMLPMWGVSVGIGLVMGPAASGALTPFKAISGTAAALLGAIQFIVPGILGICFIRGAAPSTGLFIVPMAICATVSLIIYTVTNRHSKTHSP